MEYIVVNNKEYKVIKLLGKGKGGYSYLVEYNNNFFTLKQIHYEPCSYFTFGNKLEKELIDYKKLQELNILVPKIIEVDYDKDIIIKDYIDGFTINELILRDINIDQYISELQSNLPILYKNHYNLDYYPTNFIVNNNLLYYIDFELNDYFDEWNFENWGSKYWKKTEEFIKNFINNKES